MKTLALIFALALQVLGIWPHLNNSAKSAIISKSTYIQAPNLEMYLPGQIVSLPVKNGNETLTFDGNSSVIGVDLASNTELYSQNSATPRPIASITKILTALVVLRRHSPDEIVTIPTLPNYGPSDDTIGLIAGERYRLGDLIRAALIPSANDAADSLALYDSGSIPAFTERMNSYIKEWHISGTHFVSPSGLQDTDNFATAQSLSKIAGLALTNAFIKESVKQSSVTLQSLTGRTLTHVSTNELLSTGQFYGIKTGYTQAAGECFVGLAHVNGHDVLTVVLGSTNRFGQTQTLVNWIGRNYQWL